MTVQNCQLVVLKLCAQVDAKVLKHLKSDKVIVFKKKRRKGYKVKNGHRQAITEIEISDILTGVTKKSPATKEALQKPKQKRFLLKRKRPFISFRPIKRNCKEKGLTGISSMKKGFNKALS